MGKEVLKEWIYVYVERFYEDLQDLLELTPKKKDVFFIKRDWNAKVESQAWSNRPVWPWSTK